MRNKQKGSRYRVADRVAIILIIAAIRNYQPYSLQDGLLTKSLCRCFDSHRHILQNGFSTTYSIPSACSVLLKDLGDTARTCATFLLSRRTLLD